MSIFNSKSIGLRPVEKSDLKDVLAWENDEENWIQSGVIIPYTQEEIAKYVSKHQTLEVDGQTRYIIHLKSAQVVGCIDLFDYDKDKEQASVGLLISKAFRRHGYGSEALTLISNVAKDEFHLKVLKALILSENTASIHLFKKNGFLPDDTKARIYTYKNIDYLQLAFFKTLA